MGNSARILGILAVLAAVGGCGKKDAKQEAPAQAAAPVAAAPVERLREKAEECAPGEVPARPSAAVPHGALETDPSEGEERGAMGARGISPGRPVGEPAADSATTPMAGGTGRSGGAAATRSGTEAQQQSRSEAYEPELRDANDRSERVVPTGRPAELRRDLVRTFYLSNDDSMSLSSAQRIEYAIEKGQPLPRAHIRPHELLNYYAFETAPVGADDVFSVKAELAAGEGATGGYTLALAVHGRDVSREDRRALVLTLVLDVSGSMRDEGKMEFLQDGLRKMVGQLKSGDVVSVVSFNQNAEKLLERFVVRDGNTARLRQVIDRLRPGGSTDLYAGLTTGYELAEAALDGEKNNRVILITDALTNTGTTDERLISEVGKRFDRHGIRLSGVGVGADFNDSLLDRLTERGKGAYVFVGSAGVVDRVFGEGFVSLVETIAADVRFRLDLPASLAIERFYGEEASTERSRVQAIHYFAGTSQMFLSDLKMAEGEPEAGDEVRLTIEFEDPATGERQEKTFAFKIGEILGDPSRNVLKARLLMAWTKHLAGMADHDRPRVASEMAKAEDLCRTATEDLTERARGLSGDADVSRVLELTEMLCGRFEGAGPTRRNEFPPDE